MTDPLFKSVPKSPVKDKVDNLEDCASHMGSVLRLFENYFNLVADGMTSINRNDARAVAFVLGLCAKNIDDNLSS